MRPPEELESESLLLLLELASSLRRWNVELFLSLSAEFLPSSEFERRPSAEALGELPVEILDGKGKIPANLEFEAPTPREMDKELTSSVLVSDGKDGLVAPAGERSASTGVSRSISTTED